MFTLNSVGATAPNPVIILTVFLLGPTAPLLSLGLRPCGCHFKACGLVLYLGPTALRLPLQGLRPCSLPWACGPAVATLRPAALFSTLGLRPSGCHSRACGPCYYLLNVLKLRFTKNGGFCQNCVTDAIVKTMQKQFGGIGKRHYLCNVERFSV